LSLFAAIQQPGMRSLMIQVGCEALDIVKAAGITVVPIFGIPDLDPQRPRAFVETLVDSVVNDFALPDTKTAILQDWMKGRRSEVPEMNGAIVELGKKLGIPTPFNSHILEMSEQVEQGKRAPSIDNLEYLVSVLKPTPV
jgi:2-dehydropantoate 2-reductase